MPNLGGLRACPPEKLVKLHSLRLNLGAFLMIYDPLATLYYLITYSLLNYKSYLLA